ncbi:MAG: phosphoserine phosphatase SerB [Alteromonadaceae bacterium TMED101]|nr:MAG: phosphoserine phosphatase SerB [Alteromonadaceae bacterium TMED101]
MHITILASQGRMPPLPNINAFIESQRIDVVEKVDLPVPTTLADCRCAQRWYLEALPTDLDLKVWPDLGLEDHVDVNFQSTLDSIADIKLAVFDMDSTLIQCEVIDQLADQAGVGAEVSAITEQAMRGELDFSQSFAERLGLLKGLDSGVVQQLANELPLTDGGKELILTLKTRGIKTVILSGGFDVFAERVASELGMDDYCANKLHTRAGALTGEVITPIVNAEFKEAKLRELASGMGIDMRQTMAVGDGANDLNMLNAAGIGIAFRAKPAVRLRARYRLQMVGLDGALYLIGNQND